MSSTLSRKSDNPVSIDRFHGLDAARAMALLIGVFHHGVESMITYVKSDWVTQDSQSSILLDILFYVSHVFRMQAFFLMSGFFAHLLYHRKGPREFMINRGKRLVIPFLLFWPILYAIIWNCWVWGIQYVRGIPYDQAVKLLPSYMVWSHGFPLMHLWFLYFLILFCAITVFIKPAADRWLDPALRLRKGIDHALSFLMHRWWGTLMLGAMMVVPMLGMTDWFGVDTSESGLTPRFWPFVIYGMYFTLGWFLHRQPLLLDQIRRFKRSSMLLAVGLISLLIVLSLLFSEPADPANARFVLMGLNTLYAFASMTSVFAFIGYMLHWFSEPSPRVRFLSDGAYWSYLVHLPMVAFLQILVAPLNWHWSLKLLMILGPTSLMLFLTYKFWVRRTWLGKLLNGKMYPNRS